MTEGWRDALERAGALHETARTYVPHLIEVFEEALDGYATEESLQNAYGTSDLDHAKGGTPFTRALAEVAPVKSSTWPPDALAAARGCLRLVDGLLLDCYKVLRDLVPPPPEGKGPIADRLEELGASLRERWEEPSESPTGYRCGRCGYLGVRLSEAPHPRTGILIEGRCPACGACRSWKRNDPGKAWPRVRPRPTPPPPRVEPPEERLPDWRAVMEFFTKAGDDPFIAGSGFTFSRPGEDGEPRLFQLTYNPRYRIYHLVCALKLPKVPDSLREQVALKLSEINGEIEAQGFILKEHVGYRTHAYTDADGSISSRVLWETVFVAAGLADRYQRTLKELMESAG